MFERTVLDNGLRVLVSPMPHTHSVSVGVFIGTGSRFEDDAIGGASHFIEHMLFKGTKRRPTAQDLATTIEGIGGVFNAGTGREMTNYWVKVAAPHFKTAVDVLTDMLRDSLFLDEEIQREKRVISEEIKMSQDTPEDLVQLVSNALQWPDNPLGRDVAGTVESVNSLKRDDLLQHLTGHYGPDNTVVSVAGAIDVSEVMETVGAYLGDWHGNVQQDYRPFQDAQTAPRVSVVYRPIQQMNLCLSVPSLPRDHPERFVLRLLNTILGEGMSSRLFQEIREKRGLAYQVESYIEAFYETGVMGVYAGVDPQHADQAIQAIIGEWNRMQEKASTEEELVKAREFVKGRLLLRMEDTFAVAAWNGQQELLQPEVLSVEEVIEALDAVTPAQIQSLAQRLFLPSKMNLAIVGPFGSPENPEVDRFRNLLN